MQRVMSIPRIKENHAFRMELNKVCSEFQAGLTCANLFVVHTQPTAFLGVTRDGRNHDDKGWAHLAVYISWFHV